MTKLFRVYDTDTNRTIMVLDSYELAAKVAENHFKLNKNINIETISMEILTKKLDKDKKDAER